METVKLGPEKSSDTMAKDIWLKHIADWKKQGKTASQYCREHGLSIHQFKYWQYRYAPQTKRQPNENTLSLPTISFIPVSIEKKLSTPSPKVVIFFGTKSRIEFQSLEEESCWKPLLAFLAGV